ncbi:OsmC family protein [Spiribacter vilamensis]|uniref:Putative redox protein n=1 Tax=Spiribacter vilamensis TaxID=531306 RepID=A0A4Q8D1C9_9GAMM|nr:OsmC family protein [Spiribacter vilamensis]RZU99166.1 putative redox protein [Spiribacter vilamensis]TVO61844.1 OsmC family protein [Spiribacter vilamensis]
MKAHVRWLDGMAFEAESGSGHRLTVDGPPDLGGRDRGPRPMELLLEGLGTCSAVDVVYILQRGRHPVTGCEVDIDASRADTPPKVFTGIHLHFRVSGDGLKDAAVARAVQLSAEKYCSATIMLAEACEVTHGHEVVDAGEASDGLSR